MVDAVGERIVHLVRPEPRYKWWHAAGFGLVINGISGVLTGRRSEEERAAYEKRKQAPFAPPGWLFSPAWAVNVVSLLWGDLDLMNEREDAPHHETLVAMRAAWWGLYVSFGYVYFRKDSPMLALAWTTACWGLTAGTTALALRTDRQRLATAQVTTLAWLTLATAVAAYQARQNPDPLFGYKPPA